MTSGGSHSISFSSEHHSVENDIASEMNSSPSPTQEQSLWGEQPQILPEFVLCDVEKN